MKSYTWFCFKLLYLLVQEELWATVKAEILYAARHINIAWKNAETFDCADIAQVHNNLMWQWFYILAPC